MNDEDKNVQPSGQDQGSVDQGEWPFWKKLLRRRHYLVDKRLQLNFAMLLVIIGGVNFIFFGMLFYIFSVHTTSMYEALLIESVVKQNIAVIEKLKFWRTILIGGTFECVLIILLGIFFSHRIAGPLYKISIFLKEIANGRYPGLIKLRKEDLLKNFAENVNEMIVALKDRNSIK